MRGNLRVLRIPLYGEEQIVRPEIVRLRLFSEGNSNPAALRRLFRQKFQPKPRREIFYPIIPARTDMEIGIHRHRSVVEMENFVPAFSVFVFYFAHSLQVRVDSLFLAAV